MNKKSEKNKMISVLVEMHREPVILNSSTECLPPVMSEPYAEHPKTGKIDSVLTSSGSLQEGLTLAPTVDNSSIRSFSTLNTSEEYAMQIKRAHPYYPPSFIDDFSNSEG